MINMDQTSKEVYNHNTHNLPDYDNNPELLRLLTEHKVQAISLTSGYLPESSYELVPAQDGKKAQTQIPPLFPTEGLRLYRKSISVKITTNNNLPESLFTNRYQYQIIKKYGPWRLSGDWWRSSYDRLYYQLETTNHHRFLTFHDNQNRPWFIQGGYD